MDLPNAGPSAELNTFNNRQLDMCTDDSEKYCVFTTIAYPLPYKFH